MSQHCRCRDLESMVGSVAESYADRFLVAMAADEAAGGLLRCRICGAFWDMQEDALDDEGTRRINLRRVRSAEAVEDVSQPADEG
jgi:hypothetical protein